MKSKIYLHFELLSEESQPINKITKRWVIYNKSGHTLGNIEWRPGWRTYVVNFVNCAFNEACLNEVSTFLHNQMHLYREDLKQRKVNAKADSIKKR